MTPSPQDAPAAARRLRDHLFRWRGWSVIVLAAALLVWRWPLAPRVGPVLAALPLVLLGVALRLWARSYFTRGSDTRRIQAHRLIVCGPYRRVRNPLYVGNIAIAVGLALAFAGPWAAAAFLVALAALYSVVVRSEEAILASSHGESYAEFCRRVPRWVPRLRALPADADAPAAALKHAARKEAQRAAGAVGAWALALVIACFVA